MRMALSNLAATKETAVIEPLRKTSLAGRTYARTQEIEATLGELTYLSRAEIARRAKITRSADPDFVPSECLLYFLRVGRGDNSDQNFAALYRVLVERVRRQLPRPESRHRATTGITAEAIRDDVFGRFAELVAADRSAYDERLDFFEVRFDQAIARLRKTAQEKAWRLENRSTTLESQDEAGDLLPEVEKAAAAFSQIKNSQIDDPDFRSWFDAAIDLLPSTQIRILEMIRQGIFINSQEDGQVTIAKTLGMSEKTIRNQRDRAYASLREMLRGEGN